MKLIIGLGNPGLKYKNTRHNLGFMVLDKIAHDFKFFKKFKAEIAQTQIAGEKVLLVKPQTFMNRSGESVLILVNFYKLNPKKDLLIIYDDIDLPLGKFRTTGKSAAGHLGMQSVINALKTNEIHRIRIGICPSEGRPRIPVDKFVLQEFTKEEKRKVNKVIKQIIGKLKTPLS